MAVAKADWDLMKQVADYFESTKLSEEQMKARREKQKKRGYEAKTGNNGSIRETAAHFNLTRTKVTKMLVTMGVYTSPLVKEVQNMRVEGFSVKEIAGRLGISTGTVSSYLPYTDEFHGTAEPSKHAEEVREYRAYEKAQAKRTRNLRNKKNQNSQNSQKTESYEDTGWKKDVEKEKAMSYKVDFTRPQRITWENLEECMPADRYAALIEHRKVRAEREKADRAELERLRLIDEKERTEEQKERMEELTDDLGLYPGALNYRNKTELEILSGDSLPFEPLDIMRLHLELEDWLDEEALDVLKNYGGVRGKTISRDVVVPANIPLYALHYVIQRAFGWQNSHLHDFHLTDERLKELCEGSSVQWQKMVGILFRSPLMDENAQFWADDYEYGSFKNWLRKKYTGPYLSQCREEGLYSSFYDVQDIGPETEMYVGYAKIPKPLKRYEPKGENKADEYAERPYFAGWVKDGRLRRMDPNDRVEKIEFKDYPLDGLFWLFDSDPFQLLERLPLEAVLCPGFDRLPPSVSTDCTGDGYRDKAAVITTAEEGTVKVADEEAQYFEENTCRTVTEELSFIGERIDAAFQANEDSPYNQVLPMPFATELIYRYDFGDSWKVRITASYNCIDMIEEGVIVQDTLDKANIKCRETYRPVLIARDGEMVMDDVGNLTGFANFLRVINPELEKMDRVERASARAEKKEMLEWAKGQGWKRNDAADINLL